MTHVDQIGRDLRDERVQCPLGGAVEEHVRERGTTVVEPVQRAALSILRPALDAHDVTLDVHIDTRRHGRVQFSFRSLHVNCIGVHCDLDARRDGYRQLSDT